MLNFEQFQEYVSDHIKEFLPEELQSANVELNSVNKNNGRELHAILVRPEGCSIAPTVYLDGFYESYEDGASLDSVMKDIADTSAKNQSPEEFANIAEDYRNLDFVKDRIVMAVVNAEKNQEMLQETPHKMKEDLAVIYKVMIGADAHGLASITVKQPHIDTWGIDVDQLHDYAMKNSNRLLPATVQSMDEIMRDMMSNSGMPEEMLEEMMEDMAGREPDEQMWVITNSEKINGAAGIIYSDALEQLSEKLGSDLFILPSSIHEVIAVSTNLGDPEMLASMVHEVNEGQVALDEQLSDHVYHFDAMTHNLSLADTSVEQLQAMVGEQSETYDAPTQNNSGPKHHR